MRRGSNSSRNAEKLNAFRSKIATSLTKVRPIELALFLKFLLAIRRSEHEIGEFKLWVDPASNFGKRVLDAGNYEPEVTGMLREVLKPGDTFVDVGANEGWFSLCASKVVGPEGVVVSVEPQRRLWDVLLKNFDLNQISNYRLVRSGLGRQDGVATLFLHPSINSGSSTVVADGRRRHFPKQQIPLITLDHLFEIEGLSKAKLLKIDCEGFEFEVLQGATRILAEHLVTHLYIEVHHSQLQKMGRSAEDLEMLLRSNGYVPTRIANVSLWTIPESSSENIS